MHTDNENHATYCVVIHNSQQYVHSWEPKNSFRLPLYKQKIKIKITYKGSLVKSGVPGGSMLCRWL